MPRTEEENQRIREEQKKHILQAAMRVFAHKGFAATKMADIATEANISYGLVYHYFPNKDQVLDELLEWALERGFRSAQQAMERPGTPLERLGWFVSARLKVLQEHPEFLMILHQILADAALHNKWKEIAQKKNDLSMEGLRRLIVEGQAAGQIANDDPDQLVMVLRSCLQGLTFSRLIANGGQKLPDVDIVLRLLKP